MEGLVIAREFAYQQKELNTIRTATNVVLGRCHFPVTSYNLTELCRALTANQLA